MVDVFLYLQGLKNHAVTMFEVGKLSDETMDSFVTELEKVEYPTYGFLQYSVII